MGAVDGADRTEALLFSKLGDDCSCIFCGGDSSGGSVATWVWLSWEFCAGRPAVCAEEWADCDLSSLEATRVMGGSWGGKGEIGELER